jgi:hypothetical protein
MHNIAFSYADNPGIDQATKVLFALRPRPIVLFDIYRLMKQLIMRDVFEMLLYSLSPRAYKASFLPRSSTSMIGNHEPVEVTVAGGPF